MMTPPKHIQSLIENINEVALLQSVHDKIGGSKPGRKNDVQTLNKSIIVLLTACWESYIEDLLSEAFSYMVNSSTTHKTIPMKVLTKASKELKDNKDEKMVWELAGDGWKNILQTYKDQILSNELDYFHVPRPDKIDELFEKLLGCKNICNNLKWKNMTNEEAKNLLNNFIDIRGSIAHRLKTSRSILKKDSIQYGQLLNRMGVILHNSVNLHLKNLTGTAPWQKYYFRK